MAHESEENIFLFVPNIIGELTDQLTNFAKTQFFRVCTNNTGNSRLLLYANQPYRSHGLLRGLSFTGCSRWSCCKV